MTAYDCFLHFLGKGLRCQFAYTDSSGELESVLRQVGIPHATGKNMKVAVVSAERYCEVAAAGAVAGNPFAFLYLPRGAGV